MGGVSNADFNTRVIVPFRRRMWNTARIGLIRRLLFTDTLLHLAGNPFDRGEH